MTGNNNTNNVFSQFHNQDLISADYLAQLHKAKSITYRFSNHFHPYVDRLKEQLNTKSFEGLFDANFQGKLAEGEEFFKNGYDPNESDNAFDVIYPKKQLDLSDDGSYSVYNWELLNHLIQAISNNFFDSQKNAEARKWLNYICDPTSNDKPSSNDINIDPQSRIWKFVEFRKKTDTNLVNELLKNLSDPENVELRERFERSIAAWRANPFQPHVCARTSITRPMGYKIYVIMRLIEIEIAEADSYLRQFTTESINQALLHYVYAANMLGPKPQKIPPLGKTRSVTYAMIKNKLDDLGNTLIDMEGWFPFNLSTQGSEVTDENTANSLFGIAKTLYFCIPQNDKLLEYWDIVADRLFKIRHCMDIEGIVRQLPLFEPPIDPGMLVKAVAAGIDVSRIIGGLNQPPSQIKSLVLIQKGLEICTELKAFGRDLLSAYERGEAEKIANLRRAHDIDILKRVQDVRFLQWKEAESTTRALLKSREVTYQRYLHYQLLLGKNEDANLTADIESDNIESKEITEENFEDVFKELVGKFEKIKTNEEKYLQQDSEEPIVTAVLDSKLKLNNYEYAELNAYMPEAQELDEDAREYQRIASVLSYIPEFQAAGKPMGVGFAVSMGGRMFAAGASFLSSLKQSDSASSKYEGERASKSAFYVRRGEGWVLDNNLGVKELGHIGTQIVSSLIREQALKKDYYNHKAQIDNAIAVEETIKENFAKEGLYSVLQSEISKMFYECYKFAYDIAKKAELTMKQELMRKEIDDIDFIKFNYWDTGRKGLLSGEALYLDLKKMEMARHEYNIQEYQITVNFSLKQLDYRAWLKMKATGSCEVTIPEWVWNVKLAGVYNIRLTNLGASIPSVVSSITGINCKLSILKSSIRKSPLVDGIGYSRQEGSEDNRFIDYLGTIQHIITSTANNDYGSFGSASGDSKSVFEGSGGICTLRCELQEKFRQFDYDTISTVIFHCQIIAREGGEQLKQGAIEEIKEKVNGSKGSGFAYPFSLKYEFVTEWNNFISSDNNENLKVVIKKSYFPYLAQRFTINIDKIELYALKDSVIHGRNITVDIDLDNLNTEINNGTNQSTLEITTDDKVLVRNKDANVFLVLSYSLPDV